MELIGVILSAIFIANSITCFIEWGINKIKISNKDKKQMEQIVYKIEKGDLVGDIKGGNITVILMNGDVNGDISSKEGDVVLIKGDINGDVKANKVICPQQKSDYENYIDKLSSVEELSKPDKDNKPDKVKVLRRLPPDLPPDYVRCADCAYAEDYSSNMYRCSKYNGAVTKDSVRMCDYFKEKEDFLMHDKKCINCCYCHMSEGHGLYCVINGMYTWIDDINGCGFYEEKRS